MPKLRPRPASGQRGGVTRDAATPSGGPPAGGPLDKHTKFASAPLPADPEAAARAERRRSRYALRDGVQLWTGHSRLVWCGRRRTWGADAVDVRVREGIAHFGGVALCGGIHVCPVCGPRVRQERARDLDAALATWTAARGTGSVLLLTLTLPHDRGMPLAGLLDVVRAAFHDLTSGRFAVGLRERYGLRFHVRALDCTHGGHGWHPHLHVVLLLDAPLPRAEHAALADALFGQWRHAVTRCGHRAPRREGFDLSRARSRRDLARYTMQVVYGGDEDAGEGGRSLALEVARADLKAGRRAGQRTVFEVLASAVRPLADADGVLDESVDHDRALWREWEDGSAKLHAIRWSPGLRAAVGLGAEQTDDELVAVVVGGEVVYVFSGDEWRAVLRARARARVLEAAERGGEAAVVRLLDALLRRRPRAPAASSAASPVTARA